jgi:hypothetical protein
LADAIVLNALGFGGIQPQAVLIERGHPSGDLIHRHGSGQNIVDQDAEGLLDGQLDPVVLLDIGADELTFRVSRRAIFDLFGRIFEDFGRQIT